MTTDVLEQMALELRTVREQRAMAEPDQTCQHGIAWDVHCCNCHSGFLFDVDACVCVALLHTCHDMNPPHPYPCRACELERRQQ